MYLKELELEGVVLNNEQVELVKDFADGKIDQRSFVKRAVELA